VIQLTVAEEKSDAYSQKETRKIDARIASGSRRNASSTRSINSRCLTLDLNLEPNLDLDLSRRQQFHLHLQSWPQEDHSNKVANMEAFPHFRRFLQTPLLGQDSVHPLAMEARFPLEVT
jgi:hypothetical protein